MDVAGQDATEAFEVRHPISNLAAFNLTLDAYLPR